MERDPQPTDVKGNAEKLTDHLSQALGLAVPLKCPHAAQ